jgi:L-amino acid N-acyltransferase YncA
MSIRSATAIDLPVIVDIYNAAIWGRMSTADTEAVSVTSRLAWFKEHTPESRPLVVWELEGKVLGWLSWRSFYGRPAYHATAELSIYISPTHLRQGIGTQLLQYAIRRSPEIGIKTLLAFIFAHNQASLTLFTKFGFQSWGHFPRIAELDGIERDLMVLGYRLVKQEG